MKSNETEKHHNEFTSRVASLNAWLDKAEACVLQPVGCSYDAMRDHVQHLDVSTWEKTRRNVTVVSYVE